MADVIIGGAGTQRRLRKYDQIASDLAMSINFSAVTSLNVRYATASAASGSETADMDSLRLRVNVANSYSLAGVSFVQGAKRHVVKTNGDVHRDIHPASGNGTKVGTMNATQVELDDWVSASTPVVSDFRGLAAAPVTGPFTPYGGFEVIFRTAVAPLRSGSLNLLGTLKDGTTFNVTADDNGFINATRVKGFVNYNTGVVDVFFVSPTPIGDQSTVDISFLGITGVSNVYLDQARIETLRYNAVAFSYLPLDATLLGIDPVRLPSDGRVPIFRPGGLAVIGNTQITGPETVSDAEEIDVGRVRLSRVRVIGNNGATINSGYTVDLEAGVVTFTDVTGYSQPVRVEHRIEDMVQIRDAQINGDITFLPALSHAYPEEGSYISSAVPGGDLTARVSTVFDQATWDGITFSNVPGTPAPGTYNDTLAPIEVTNAGAETERWALRFTSATAFQIFGEHVGVIGVGNINEDCEPINPVSGEPYFTIREVGWGVGWAIGNILRINTVGARFPVWCVRTVRQGPETGEDYSFALLTRGDVDNPL